MEEKSGKALGARGGCGIEWVSSYWRAYVLTVHPNLVRAACAGEGGDERKLLECLEGFIIRNGFASD